jgi:hypothetical protein
VTLPWVFASLQMFSRVLISEVLVMGFSLCGGSGIEG